METDNIQVIREEPGASRIGALFVFGMFLALPLLLAYLFASWSLAVAAYHLLMAQWVG